MPTIVSASPPDPDADAVVSEGLRGHLRPLWGSSEREAVSWYLRDDEAQIVGGVAAHVAWSWLYVERIWVDPSRRGRGHGAALMAAAESFARQRRCVGVYLDTFGDEALPFYQRLGYDVWGTLDGLPPGGRKHVLRKRLR